MFIKRSLYLSICFSLMVSFCSFADAYTGAYMTTETDSQGLPVIVYHDVDPTGQTYSGQNVIEYNALDNTPNLTSNTFNGSTEINTAYTDITSTDNTYNGTTDINYLSSIGGNLQSTNDTFQTANLSAADADVAFTNPEFNGSVSLQANSISLGSISQMDTLIDTVYPLVWHISNTYYSANNNTSVSVNSPSGNSLSVPLLFDTQTVYLTYDSVNRNLVSNQVVYSCSFSTFLATNLFYLWQNFNALGQYLLDKGNYNIYSFSVAGEYYNITSTSTTSDWHSVILNRFDILYSLVNYYCSRIYEWFYPLDSSGPFYWRYYNTDTGQSESIGLAGLMYNISWYLGEIYENLVQSGTQLTQDAEDLADSISDLNTAENTVFNQVQSSFNSVPSLMTFPTITAAASVVGWIEYMWASLGIFQAPTLLGYMAVILMMLVGYAKFKGVFK